MPSKLKYVPNFMNICLKVSTCNFMVTRHQYLHNKIHKTFILKAKSNQDLKARAKKHVGQ